MTVIYNHIKNVNITFNTTLKSRLEVINTYSDLCAVPAKHIYAVTISTLIELPGGNITLVKDYYTKIDLNKHYCLLNSDTFSIQIVPIDIDFNIYAPLKCVLNKDKFIHKLCLNLLFNNTRFNSNNVQQMIVIFNLPIMDGEYTFIGGILL